MSPWRSRCRRRHRCYTSLSLLTRRLQTLKVASDIRFYLQRNPALKHFTLSGRTEVLLRSFWGQISGTFALENLKKESDWEKDQMRKGRVTLRRWCHFFIPHPTPLVTSGSSWTSMVVSNHCVKYIFSFPLAATLLFVTGEKAIHHLFSRDTPYELGYAYVAMTICLNATLEKTIISGLQTLKLVRFCKK